MKSVREPVNRRSFGRALLLAAALASAGGAAPASAKWIELRTEHFRLLSDASPTKLHEIATSLEAFRAVVAKSTTGLKLAQDPPLTIVVFKDDDSFDPYKDRSDLDGNRVLGFFSPTPERYVVALNATPAQNINVAREFKRFRFPYATIYHEYTHALLGRAFASCPAWLDEGIAEYFSTFFIHGNSAELGHGRPEAIATLHEGFRLPIDKLVTLPRFGVLPAEVESMAYAESWLIVHSLLRGSPERRKQFAQFLTALRDGAPQAEAFAAAFPVPWPVLQREAMEHLRLGMVELPVYAVDELGVHADGEPVPVEPGIMDDELGEVAVLTRDDRLEVPEQRFQSALSLSVKDARALAGLGLVETKRGRLDKAEALYRRALEAAPDDPTAHFRLGNLLLMGVGAPRAAAPPSDALPPRAAEARTHFEATLLAQPDHVAAARQYGRTFLFDPGDRSAGIAALQAALQREPASWPTAELLGTLQRWDGDLGSALALLDGRAARNATPNEVNGYRNALLDTIMHEALARSDREGPTAAAAWLKQLLPRTKEELTAGQLRTWIATFETTAAGKKSD